MAQGDPLAALAVDVAKVHTQCDQLAQIVADLSGRVDELDKLADGVGALTDQVSTLAAAVEAAATAKTTGGVGSVQAWAAVVKEGTDPDSPVGELVTWLDSVFIPQYGEYLRLRQEVEGTLPHCWAKHRSVGNELWTLYQLWRAVYENEDARPREAGDWHDRWLPGALERMGEVFKRRCSHYERDLTSAVNA